MTDRQGGTPPVGRVNGQARNRENRRQKHHENRSAHVAAIGALIHNDRMLHEAAATVAILRTTELPPKLQLFKLL